MKKRQKKYSAIILALTLAFTSMFAVPVMAETNSASQTATTAGTQTTNSTKLTQAQKEAAAVKQYGTYKGKNATKIPVITYHYVVSDRQKRSGQFSGSSLAVSRSAFESQMKWLKKNGYRTISCEEFYLWYKGKIKLPPKSILITFDDGYNCVVQQALPVLSKYKMKGTMFIVGYWSYYGKNDTVSMKTMAKVRRQYPNLEFQSHTWNMHTPNKSRYGFYITRRDAKNQKKVNGFEYLAYPYGRNNSGMIRAYKDTGIKLAFTYGNYGSGFATRKQNIYQIRRIKIAGGDSLSTFVKKIR